MKKTEALKKAVKKQTAYIARLKNKGYVCVHIWVPEALKETIKAFAKEKMTKYEKK